MAKTQHDWRPNLDDRAVCEALIALIRAGRVIALRDPADPLGMRLASAEAALGREVELLSVDEACRRLRAASN